MFIGSTSEYCVANAADVVVRENDYHRPRRLATALGRVDPA